MLGNQELWFKQQEPHHYIQLIYLLDYYEKLQSAEMYFLELGVNSVLFHPVDIRNLITLYFQIISIYLMPCIYIVKLESQKLAKFSILNSYQSDQKT